MCYLSPIIVILRHLLGTFYGYSCVCRLEVMRFNGMYIQDYEITLSSTFHPLLFTKDESLPLFSHSRPRPTALIKSISLCVLAAGAAHSNSFANYEKTETVLF